MVSVYAIDSRLLPDPKENPALLHRLGSSRRRKVMKYLQADDRKRCMGAGLLLAEILPLYGGNPEKITCGPEGKPQTENVQFNLSHSGNLVICAAGGKAVGCDIEKIEKEPEGVAECFFHRKEAQYLQKFKGPERSAMFFRLWTWKESYVKMTGEGLNLPLQDFEVLPEGERIRVRRGDAMLPCHIMEYDIPGYQVSVCAEEETFSRRVEYVDPFRPVGLDKDPDIPCNIKGAVPEKNDS